MYAVFLLFWVMASITIIGNPKSNSNRWLFVFGIFVVFGLLTIPLEDQIIPWFVKNSYERANSISQFKLLDSLLTTLFHYFVPYTFLMFSISFTGYLHPHKKILGIRLDVLLILPVLLMYIVFPVNSPNFNPDSNPYFYVIALWAIPYILCADLLILYTLFKEKDFRIKRDILVSCIILLPGSLFILLMCFILVLFNIHGGYRYYLPAIIIEFIAFSILGVKYGVFGVKFKIEKSCLDRTMKAMTSGAAILNHAYKNEIYKISMSVSNIKASEAIFNKKDFDTNISENIQVISNSINHMLGMSSRIKDYMQEIILKESPHQLNRIINDALNSMLKILMQKQIRVKIDCDSDMEIICDEIHMHEVFGNIFRNSFEAMNMDGLILIRTYINRRGLIIEVKDDGDGIPKENLPYVLDPFFSTKNRKLNFGLGLSYCYNIMQKHGGELSINSEENEGTTVCLKFPRSKLFNYRKRIKPKKPVLRNI